MSKPYDATTKSLIEVAPEDWLELIGWKRRGPVEVINADLSTVTRMADKVIRVGGRAPAVVHFELQSGHDAGLAYRLLGYHGMLVERHRLPVRTVLVLLRPGADGPAITGRLTMRGSIRFRYDVIRVWEVPVERVLGGGLGVLPMAPIADLGPVDPAEVIRRMDRRLRAEAGPAEADLIWSSSWVLMGLKYERELVDRLLKGVREMKESSTYQGAVQEGIELGRSEGIQLGRQEGLNLGLDRGKVEEARNIVLEIGGKWLGEPDKETLEYLRELEDRRVLEGIIERLRVAQSWEDVFRKP